MDTKIEIGSTSVDLYDNRTQSPGEPLPALPDLSDDEWWITADDTWSSEPSNLYRWTLADEVYLYVDCAQSTYPDCAVVEELDAADHLSNWDHDCDTDEWLADWGIDPALDEADEDWDGACRVWHKGHYYGDDHPGRYARDDDSDEIREFRSYAEADAYVHDYYTASSGYDGIPACNVLAHNQASSDTLTICKA